MAKRNRLHSMSLDEISLVDRGANPGARVVIFKRDGLDENASDLEELKKSCCDSMSVPAPAMVSVMAETFDELEQKEEVRDRINEYRDMVYTLNESLNSILNDPDLQEDERMSLLEQSIQEFRDAVTKEIADEGAPGADTSTMTKRSDLMDIEELEKRLEANEQATEALKKENVDLKEQVTKAEEEKEELMKAFPDGMKCKMPDGSEGTMKGGKCMAGNGAVGKTDDKKSADTEIPEPVKKVLDEQKETIEKLAKENEESRGTIAKMREEAEVKEAIAKAAQDFPKLPVKADELGPVVRKVKKALSKEEWDILEKGLKAGNEALAQAMKERGAGGELDSSEGTAYHQAMAKAKEFMKDTKDRKMTIEKAFTQILENDPALARKVSEEERASSVSH